MYGLKKISSEDLLQELINRKVLTQIPADDYKPINFDGVMLLHKAK